MILIDKNSIGKSYKCRGIQKAFVTITSYNEDSDYPVEGILYQEDKTPARMKFSKFGNYLNQNESVYDLVSMLE